MSFEKKITIRDVATAAGVSHQTVSRVLNDRHDVARETRRRVQQVIEQLGYQPSYIARSLTQGQSCTLGVISYGVEFYGPSHALSGIEKQANELGFTLLLSLVRQPEFEDHIAAQILRDMLARQVDGIIWAVPKVGNNQDWVQKQASQLSAPIVFISRGPCPHLSVIDVDNHSGGRMATEHLMAQGYQNIGLVTGPLSWQAARQRKLGWQDALEQAGRTVEDSLIVEGDWGAESGARGMRQLLERRPDVDAVFVCNDQMALGGLQAARQLGRQTPDDLALVGFDDIPESGYFCPPLTTVQQQIFDLGSCAVRELNRLIEAHRQGDADVQPRTILLQPKLIIRESTAAKI